MVSHWGKTCPYCKEEIKFGDSVTVCPECGTAHHAECWEKNGGCTTLGCKQCRKKAAKYCGYCGAPMEEGQMFCGFCGKSAQGNGKADRKTGKKSGGKKAIKIVAILGAAAALALVFALYLMPSVIMPAVNVSRAYTAIEKYDYTTAIELFEKSGKADEDKHYPAYQYALGMEQYFGGNYVDAASCLANAGDYLTARDRLADCGKMLLESKNYSDAAEVFSLCAEEHKAEYNFALGMEQLTDKNYAKAAEYLTEAGDFDGAEDALNYANGLAAYQNKEYASALAFLKSVKDSSYGTADILIEIHYNYGLSLFAKEDYTNARTQFNAAGDYEDAAKYATGCLVMEAEHKLQTEGILAGTKAYDKLDAATTFNGISVLERQTALHKLEDFADLEGKYRVTENTIISRCVERNGGWTEWGIDAVQGEQSLDVRCFLNQDGTVNIKGTIEYYRFEGYSADENDLISYLHLHAASFTVEGVSKVPSKFEISEYETLKRPKNGPFFEFTYSEKDYANSSAYYNLYKTTLAFDIRRT